MVFHSLAQRPADLHTDRYLDTVGNLKGDATVSSHASRKDTTVAERDDILSLLVQAALPALS
jgi:hypothetical protein